MGDGSADNYEFKVNVFPTPDGITRKFFTGQTRLIPDTLEVFLDGAPLVIEGDVTDVREADGTFEMVTAPSGELQASFYYRRFTDGELAAFLDDASQTLALYNDTTVTFAQLVASVAPSGDLTGSISITQGVRPSLLQFAAFHAYMRMAAVSADMLSAGAPGGFSLNTQSRLPNWRDLAKQAWETGNAKLKLYVDNPISRAAPEIRFVSYTLQRYQPR